VKNTVVQEEWSDNESEKFEVLNEVEYDETRAIIDTKNETRV